MRRIEPRFNGVAYRMIAIDEYRKGWALRYLREARAELIAAQADPKAALNLIFNAMRKAQAAIYHSLGDPVLIEGIIQQEISDGNLVEDPILRCLVEIERSIRQVASRQSLSTERSLMEAENVVRVASEIVNLFAEEVEN